MTAPEIPAEIVEAAARAWADFETPPPGEHYVTWAEYHQEDRDVVRAHARHALAAVLPLLPPGTWLSEETQRHVAHIIQAQRQMALEEATAALKAAYKEPPTHVLSDNERAGWQIGMARAHRIVRDLSRTAHTDPEEPK